MRVGIGYDVHRLVKGRKLILGGVQIRSEKGLWGHSDADALSHAIGDALLGAAALGDLGTHFPDSDERYKDISSLTLLEEIRSKLTDKGFRIINIDATIVAQAPKLAPYIEKMRERLSDTLKVPLEDLSVKATTTEGLGFAGKGEGIACYAIASVERT
ncbi:MAG: 2-C-methyl-D-erythritol 2,4-cyclodiphosphate synthase [candidate division Zixibacteria bacterium DG_27]|nr:MAG: 2-C-methyl-D-erythritol 2,4-cyclodiphosphate synthase [candidate division Zixibacteria bacterium DG_27]